METLPADRTAIQEAIADEVRAELARKRLSGVRAARALGWTQNYIARRMIGAVPFDSVDLVELSGLLDVPVAKFFDGIGAEQRVRSSVTRLPVRLAAAA